MQLRELEDRQTGDERTMVFHLQPRYVLLDLVSVVECVFDFGLEVDGVFKSAPTLCSGFGRRRCGDGSFKGGNIGGEFCEGGQHAALSTDAVVEEFDVGIGV